MSPKDLVPPMEANAANTLRREVFTVRLKPGALDEWRRRHEQIWPELAEAERQCGVVWMSIFATDDTLFVYSEVLYEDSWERLIDTPVHRRWVEFMKDLSDSSRDDNTIERDALAEVFHRVYMPEVLTRLQ